jgi:hypothetical protein
MNVVAKEMLIKQCGKILLKSLSFEELSSRLTIFMLENTLARY